MTAEDLDTVVTLFKGLADPTRLRMVAAMVDRARCGQDLANEIGVAPATISHHLKVLGKAGLLIETRQPPYVFYKIDLEAVQRAVRAVATPKRVRELTTAPPVDDDTQKVLRTFFDGPRLRALPVQRRKKELVLEEVLRRIPRRREYPEADLNAFIEVIFDDYCTVRREWIMGQYMTREALVYRLAPRGQAIVNA
ncbi:MAG: metalloregulator ArsR/SmtB family transcription factor [Deltaproteobacteria bacterium]|nr:metalloregulator ArsR/SmtB family transcription factor [Deltaproteobacteria bacterium]